jgi:cbb3-type cytochrome oxidase subunit 3
MDGGGATWGIINIVGPLLLVIVIAWAFLKNRKSKVDVDQSERATHEAYDAEERTRREHDER